MSVKLPLAVDRHIETAVGVLDVGLDESPSLPEDYFVGGSSLTTHDVSASTPIASLVSTGTRTRFVR